MTRRTATTITVTTLAVFAVLGLTACDPGAPKPTGSNTPSPTVSSSPTASASDRPMPPQADAPKTSDEAIAAAAKTYHAYLDAQLPFLKDLTLGPQYLSGYVLQGSPEWQSLNDTVDQQKEAPIVSGGPAVFTPNDAMSVAVPATSSKTGQKLDFGAVSLYGCSDNTKITFRNTSIPKGSFAAKAVLVYVADAHAWMVQESRSMRPTDGEAMPQC
ncbi:hypothetical protein [Microbacterium xylanilyticum]